MKNVIALALLAVLFVATAADGVLTEWRTQVQVSVGPDGSPQFAFDGGLNDPFASQTLSNGSSTSEASSSLSPSGFVPTLRAKADNSSGAMRAQALALGVQGYTNTSASPLNTTLSLNLTSNITGNNDVRASIYLFQDENFEFQPDPGTILFESSSQVWPGFESLTNNLGSDGFDISFKDHTGQANATRSFNFTVDPGDSFYVWSFLLATADNIGVSDASSTLTASFSNIQGLTPVAITPETGTGGGAVPEPGTAILSLMTLGVLGMATRRRAA